MKPKSFNPGIGASALALVAILSAAPVSAQGFLSPAPPERGINLEFSHPNPKAFDVTAPTSVWHLSAQLPLTVRLRGVVDLPLAYAEFKGDEAAGLGSNSVFGNPYLGVVFQAPAGFAVEVGARAPLTSADETSFADVIGVLDDIQRAEAFLEDVVPVSGRVTYERRLLPALALQARGGVTTVVFTGTEEDDDGRETETFLDYGVFGTYELGMARMGAGLSGRWNATGDEGSFSDRSIHQAGLTLDAALGPVRPGVSLRIPLDKDYRNVMGSSVGLYVHVPIP